jgi:hypothetical protein
MAYTENLPCEKVTNGSASTSAASHSGNANDSAAAVWCATDGVTRPAKGLSWRGGELLHSEKHRATITVSRRGDDGDQQREAIWLLSCGTNSVRAHLACGRAEGVGIFTLRSETPEEQTCVRLTMQLTMQCLGCDSPHALSVMARLTAGHTMQA